MKKINIFFIFLLFFFNSNSNSFSEDYNFEKWLDDFKILALKNDISEKTFNLVMNDAKFLPKVIEYDRYQPEFYEDTATYISKRTSRQKIINGIKIYKQNKKLINHIDQEFFVEKELLLALMGIETNFGTYLGKMNIISSLATLSYDKRRSDFFTKELITVLKLIENNVVDYKILFGSWAGAFGNFQFMPSTIEKYAIDYNMNKKIELKQIDDSFASAANYINKIGWEKNKPCFFEVDLKKNVPQDLLNTSAKKIKNKKKISYLKKYIKNFNNYNIDENLIGGFITPDKDIVADANILKPAYLVFKNYELILKWNRSLRFALAVCTLKDKFTDEL